MAWEDATAVAGLDQINSWVSLLEERPEALWGLIADVVKAAKASQGERRTGRRPAVSVGSLDELYAVLFPPSYSTKPFCDTFAVLLGDRSQRAFATRVGFNQATVSRLLAGKSQPSPQTIERIAKALGVRPTFFAEYRALKLGEIVTDVLLANPDLSADSLRRMAVT